MNNRYTNEFRDIKLASKNLQEHLKSFEKGIKSVFYEHFVCLNAIAYYIFHKVEDTEVLEAKLEKCMKKLRLFCTKYSKFITIKKFSLLQTQDSGSALHEDVEFVLNHEEKGTFIDRGEMKKFSEMINKYGGSVKVKPSFTTEANKDFEKLKDDVKGLNEKINKDPVDPSELMPALDKLTETCESYEIEDHYKDLKVYSDAVHNKHVKYSRMYYHRCVLKQQTVIVYEKTKNEKADCAVCLEELKNGANVTKLKCGHMYCTGCIEKWLSSSITCPYCRQSPEYP